MTTQSKTIAASEIAALFVVAVFNVYAGDPDKAGGSSDKARGSLDNDAAKSQGTNGKPGQHIVV